MKLGWDQLEAMLEKLTDDFLHHRIDDSEYVNEWNELIEFAGWTWEEFATEVEKRWTPQKRAESPLFKC